MTSLWALHLVYHLLISGGKKKPVDKFELLSVSRNSGVILVNYCYIQSMPNNEHLLNSCICGLDGAG